MFTLFCTKRLLARVKPTVASHAPEATTMLGNWGANVVTIGRTPWIIAVSERTFLPIVFPAAPFRELVSRLRMTLVDVLRELGVPEEAIAREAAAMEEVAFQPSRNRQLTGVLVEYDRCFDIGDGLPPVYASLRMAQMPLAPIYKTWRDEIAADGATRRLFGVAPRRTPVARHEDEAAITRRIDEVLEELHQIFTSDPPRDARGGARKDGSS